MEFDILDALDDLGYAGSLKTDEEIKTAIELGPKSIEFTQLVEWLSKELQALNNMESCIHALTDCPYKSLLNGPISQRLIDIQSHRTLLDYLCTELLAARLLYSKKEARNNVEEEMICENCGECADCYTSSTALALKNALRALNIKIDSSHCEDPEAYLVEMENKIRRILDSKSRALPPAILSEKLSEQQWESLRTLYEDFLDEYTIRRRLLLTRLEVTMQSFKWGEASKNKETKLINAYLPKRKLLKDEPSVKFSDVIAARENLLVLEKTSSANLVKNTKSSVNKVLIPAVPDRGGRPKEQRPPVEMPNWKKRSQDGGWGGGHRGGGGGGNWRGQNKKFQGDRGGRGKSRGNFDAAGGGHHYSDHQGKYSKGHKRRH